MAKGSHATYGGWEPRTCWICGERITLTGKHARGAEFRFNVETGKATSRHVDCTTQHVDLSPTERAEASA